MIWCHARVLRNALGGVWHRSGFLRSAPLLASAVRWEPRHLPLIWGSLRAQLWDLAGVVFFGLRQSGVARRVSLCSWECRWLALRTFLSWVDAIKLRSTSNG